MDSKSDLGDRMKRYELSWSSVLPPNSWAVLRIDGRAFHTWTRGADRPFDVDIASAMRAAAMKLASDINGFRVAYLQSDEASFVSTDTTTYISEPWFGGKVSKIVSVAASAFTAWFNDHMNASGRPEWVRGPAMFDCRVFTMPPDDVANVLIWRQRDWERNSLQMLARSYFSHGQLYGKKTEDLHEMLHGAGVNWADLPLLWKNGTFIYFDDSSTMVSDNIKRSYEMITKIAGIL